MEQLVDHMSNKLSKPQGEPSEIFGELIFLAGKCGIAGVPLGSHENIENTAQVPSTEFEHLYLYKA